MDWLAREGIRFDQAFTGGSWTQSAFPSILTSSYASMYGGCLNALSPDRPGLVESLANQGLATAGFSTNPHVSKRTRYNRGFSHFEDLTPVGEDPLLRRIKGGHRLLERSFFHQLASVAGWKLQPAPVYAPASDVTRAVCGWIAKQTGQFFVWAHYMDVHWPYHLAESFDSSRETAEAWRDLSGMTQHSSADGDWTQTYARKERFMHLYRRSLRYVDNQIGILVKFLADRDLTSNTIIMILADHGEEFFDHGRWGHLEDNLYEEIMRIPLILRLPWLAGGTSVSQLVRTLDVMPTLLDLVGCPVPKTAQGTSLRSLWEPDKGDYPVDVAICEMCRPPKYRLAVRTESLKYIWDNLSGTGKLFNLIEDPAETTDISGRDARSRQTMQDRVELHLSRVGGIPDRQIVDLEPDEVIERRLRALGYLQ